MKPKCPHYVFYPQTTQRGCNVKNTKSWKCPICDQQKPIIRDNDKSWLFSIRPLYIKPCKVGNMKLIPHVLED